MEYEKKLKYKALQIMFKLGFPVEAIMHFMEDDIIPFVNNGEISYTMRVGSVLNIEDERRRVYAVVNNAYLYVKVPALEDISDCIDCDKHVFLVESAIMKDGQPEFGQSYIYTYGQIVRFTEPPKVYEFPTFGSTFTSDDLEAMTEDDNYDLHITDEMLSHSVLYSRYSELSEAIINHDFYWFNGTGFTKAD